jgi:hypothetical protein
MLDRLPTLQQFSRLYWHQMGDEVYGTIERAFREFLGDAARLPDQGRSIRRALYGELMLIRDNPAYGDWVQFGLYDRETGRSVGGRFIMPEQVAPLMGILDEKAQHDS